MRIDKKYTLEVFTTLDSVYEELNNAGNAKASQKYFTLAYLKFLKNTGNLIVSLYYESLCLYNELDEDISDDSEK